MLPLQRRIRLILQTDGASRGNPGPAAAGAVIKNESGQTVAEFGTRLGNLTNNEAEYRALWLGIEHARKLGATELEIRLDSDLLVAQVRGDYKVRAANLKPLHKKILDQLKHLNRFTITHVYREANRRADQLANRALDEK